MRYLMQGCLFHHGSNVICYFWHAINNARGLILSDSACSCLSHAE